MTYTKNRLSIWEQKGVGKANKYTTYKPNAWLDVHQILTTKNRLEVTKSRERSSMTNRSKYLQRYEEKKQDVRMSVSPRINSENEENLHFELQ